MKSSSYSTAILLAAFCSMAIPSSLNAGLVNTSGSNWEYQIGGPDPDFQSFTGAVTVNVPTSVVDPDLVSPHNINLAAGTYWMTSGDDMNISIEGKVQTFNTSGQLHSISATGTANLTIDLAANSNYQVYSLDYGTRGISIDSGNLDLGTVAGTLSVTGQVDPGGDSNVYAIKAGSGAITSTRIAETGIISAAGTGQHIYGIHTGGTITIGTTGTGGDGDMAGDFLINTKRSGESDSDYQSRIVNTSNVHGIYANGAVDIKGALSGNIEVHAGKSSTDESNASAITSAAGNISIGSIAETGEINVTGTGDGVSGIHASAGNVTISGPLAGDIDVQSNGNQIFGIFGQQGVTLDSIADTSLISVTGAGNVINGISAGSANGLTITNQLAGDITVVSTTDGATGLYSSGSVTIGSIAETSQITATGAGSDVNGIQGNTIDILGDFAGDITLNSTASSFRQYAMTAINDININAFTDTASITITGNSALGMGLRSQAGNVNITNQLAGDITVNGSTSLYGINAGSGVSIGALSGDISATGTSDVTGIHAGQLVDIGTVTSGGQINVTTTNDQAYGIRSISNSIDIDYLSGNITIDAGNNANVSNAYGLYADNDITIGDFDDTSNIEINATGSNVAGFYTANGDFTSSNTFVGDVTINAGQNAGASYAYGIRAADNVSINFVSADSHINIAATGSNVAGIYAGSDLEITSTFGGRITATGGKNTSDQSFVSGLYATDNVLINSIAEESHIHVGGSGTFVRGIVASSGDLDITGNLAGDITVFSTGHNSFGYSSAMGIQAEGFGAQSIRIGNITSTSNINVTGSGRNVYGITTQGSGGITINTIAGSIYAQGASEVYGIEAHNGPITIGNITGIISAIATDPSGVAAAISSESYAGGTWSPSNRDDSITLSTGANIIGDIRLSDQTTADVLTLRGTGTYNHNLYGIETLNINQNSDTTSTQTETWQLNFANDYDNTDQRNVFDTINVNHGTLGFNRNIKTTNLNVAANGGLHYTLDAASKTTSTIETTNASFNDGANISTQLNGPLQGEAQFTLVDSVNTITFESDVTGLNLIKDTALIDYEAELSSTGNQIILTASTFADLQEYANTPAFKAAQSLQDAFDADLTGDAADVLDKFQDLSEEELAEQLNKITPQQSLSTANAATETTSSIARSLTVRTQTLNAGQAIAAADSDAYPLLFSGPTMRDEDGYEFWTSAFGSFTEQDDDGSIPGYESKAAGTLVGLDRMTGNVLLGAAFGFAHADIDSNQSRGSTDLDAFTLGAYFAWTDENFKFEGGSIYTLGLADYKRETALGRTAEADDVNSHTFTNYLGVSYDIVSNDKRLAFIPNAQIAYTYFTQEKYEESKAGALNLNVDSFDNDIVTATVGLKSIYQASDNLKLNAQINYKYDFANDAPTVTSTFQSVGSTPFSTTGIESDKNAIEFGTGFDYQINDRMKASFDYAYEHRSSLKTQNITLGLNILF
ncbi:Outer membrane protein B precursor [Poriferisphaera corsica]|uniref:Outer membrane protein B n=1 Tax=Poriferisphaera corsica TaxID=2528020 RepID=A0A517YYJ2_9BACT|nr:autotransporter outer membrane beta-barrel domain-containing protein [Poriferisphaera corsica]QDU35290.1 Outer membrane protein B precursor [Poriferisphaera corsica]